MSLRLFQEPKKYLKNFIQFFKFGIVGLSNTVIAYAVYAIFITFGVYYIIANLISFFAGITNSFFWNSKFVFNKRKDKGFFFPLIKAIISYSLTGIILANILLFLSIEILNISQYLAPLVSLVITVPSNFFLNKYWVFKE